MSKHERWGRLCHFCEESWPCETETLRTKNARLRQYAQSGAATFEDLYVRDQEIARLREQAEALEEELEQARQSYGTLNEYCDYRIEQAEALADGLRNQGLLQNTFHGKVWHIHDCPASFDFAECNYRCRVAREAFALAGTEPYVSPETRRDTEVYEMMLRTWLDDIRDYTARECLTDDEWNTLLSLAYDGQMFRALNEKGHVVEFDEGGYGLEHPATCRIEGRLLDCPVEVAIRSLTGNPFGKPGRYRVVIGETGVLEGWKLPEKDTLDV